MGDCSPNLLHRHRVQPRLLFRARSAGGDRIRQLLRFMLVVGLAGCNPYLAATTVVRETYGAATDLRSLSTQEMDKQAELQLKAALVASLVKSTSGTDVFCRQGVVVLAGVVPPGSSAGPEAVRLARGTAGVKRVQTYFVGAWPSWTSDLETKEEIRAKLVADPDLVSGRVDIGVHAGHVVLVGVVPPSQKADKFVADARSMGGVVDVTSFIQTL